MAADGGQKPRRRRPRPFGRGMVALAISLALHAALLAGLAALGVGSAALQRPIDVVGLAPLTASDWEANRAIEGQPREAPRPVPSPPPPEPPAPDVRGSQVVEVSPEADGAGQKPNPDEAVLWANRDSFARKNQVSRSADAKNPNNLPSVQSGRLSPAAARVAGEGGLAKASKPGVEGQIGQGGTGSDRLAVPRQGGQESVARAPDGEVGLPARPGRDRLTGGGDRMDIPGLPGQTEAAARSAGALDERLRPSTEALERIAGGPTFSIEGMDEGESTILNAREFKYATYFNRVHRGIGEQWDPERAYNLRDPDLSLYPVRDRRTELYLKLDATGAVKELRLVNGSGLAFLDQEAMRAVRAAAPFPNPPPAVVRDGEIDWGPLVFTYRFGPSGGPRLRWAR